MEYFKAQDIYKLFESELSDVLNKSSSLEQTQFLHEILKKMEEKMSTCSRTEIYDADDVFLETDLDSHSFICGDCGGNLGVLKTTDINKLKNINWRYCCLCGVKFSGIRTEDNDYTWEELERM